jgi:hypothetical protein
LRVVACAAVSFPAVTAASIRVCLICNKSCDEVHLSLHLQLLQEFLQRQDVVFTVAESIPIVVEMSATTCIVISLRWHNLALQDEQLRLQLVLH